MDIINPATGEIITTIATDTPESIEEKFRKLQMGQPVWREMDIKHRLECIHLFHDLMENKKAELARTLTLETGKPITQAENEINGALYRIRYFIEESEKWLEDEWVYEKEYLREKIVYEPLGIIGNISAWNYPYLVGVNVFIPALIAGNAVLYKPSEYSTLTGRRIHELMMDAAIPDYVFEIVTGGPEAGEALLGLPLDGYFFTGSYKTGKYIYEKVAPKMVPCQLELGGKDPLYVAADNSNVKLVAQAAVDGAFYNNGQSCCAVERIYVHRSLFDPFVEAFIAALEKLKMGDPLDRDTYFGPLTRKAQLTVLHRQVQDALAKGATLLTGGNIIADNGYYFEPTVLINVNHDMLVMREESFGPVIGIMAVDSDEQAVELMQDTEYGLTASVFSDNQETAEKILRKLNTGTVYWNTCDRVSPRLPWSGRKHSGIGVTLSHLGIRAFTRPKAYHLKSRLTG